MLLESYSSIFEIIFNNLLSKKKKKLQRLTPLKLWYLLKLTKYIYFFHKMLPWYDIGVLKFHKFNVKILWFWTNLKLKVKTLRTKYFLILCFLL